MKIIVGISGGVDSSVTALILKQQGYEVEALFMKNWHEEYIDGSCTWEADVEDALKVCEKLSIPLNTIDLSFEYWESVFKSFLRDYRRGATPNPDILCNQEIKFKAFIDHALNLGAEKIATGHYAQIQQNSQQINLLRAVDTHKDQSYFLCRLTQNQLSKSLFPVGDIQKNKVRKMAANAQLVTHDKKDSTGICFVGERPFREFLSQYIPVCKGEIQTVDGKTIGEHNGAIFYTIGQRQGLGIGGVMGAPACPWYVVNKDIDSNILYVAQGHDNPLLFSLGVNASSLHWIGYTVTSTPFRCTAKTRYRQTDQPCTIKSIEQDSGKIMFDEQQRAVTPGQYIVFYKDNTCLGGGIIDNTWS